MNPIDIFNKFFESLTDEQFDEIWAEVEAFQFEGPLAEEFLLRQHIQWAEHYDYALAA